MEAAVAEAEAGELEVAAHAVFPLSEFSTELLTATPSLFASLQVQGRKMPG